MNDYVSHFLSKQKFVVAIAKYQPWYFKFHLPFHIIDEDRITHTTISFYMVLKHKNLTDKMRRTEIPPTNSFESLMPPTVCCSFFTKCHNAWPYMSYVNVSCRKKQEYRVKRVNKVNSFPFKAVFCYFYHCFAYIIHASMDFSTPVRWRNAMSYVAIHGSHF